MANTLRLASLYALFLALQVAATLLFMAVEGGVAGADWPDVVWHSLPMSASVAAYFTALPWLCEVVASLSNNAKLNLALRGVVCVWIAIACSLWSCIAVLDLALYPHWGFRLDAMPVFYFLTSPSAAMASVTWGEAIGGILAIAALAVVSSWVAIKTYSSSVYDRAWHLRAWLGWLLLALSGGALFIAVRGGVTVSTMNPGRSYFSSDEKLNQAALNPVFNLIYSCTHQSDFASRYRYMDEQRAQRIVAGLYAHATSPGGFSSLESRPDVYLIILESFSAHLMPSLGGESIAVGLDSIARQSISFTDFYASSFRTDRALGAILYAYPALPSVSLLKYPEKFHRIPSLPKAIKDAGYELEYYYGGDINFTNMNALLATAGFDRVVSDKDFAMGQKLSKWGAHDDVLFGRVEAELARRKGSAKKHFTVIQTSSSHEPFDVPFDADPNPRINAFKFADAQVTKFVNFMCRSALWDNALIVIVADHFGVYPQDPGGEAERHHIPLIMTGGALQDYNIDRHILSLPGSQTDIAATILALAGIDHSQLPFSRNLLAPGPRPFAIFSGRSEFGVKMPGGKTAIISAESGKVVNASDKTLEEAARAYLQTVATDMARR